METTFNVGDYVIPDKEAIKTKLPHSTWLFNELKDEPFPIIKVIKVDCSCGEKNDNKHAETCLISRVGHMQHIIISLKGEEKKYSGCYFKKPH